MLSTAAVSSAEENHAVTEPGMRLSTSFLNRFLLGFVSYVVMRFFSLPQRAHKVLACALMIVLSYPLNALANSVLHHERQHTPRHLLVGYFPQWGIDDPEPFYVKALVTNGSAARLDQIDYAQGAVRDGHCSLADPESDLNTTYTSQNSVNGIADADQSSFRGYFHQLKELKHRYPKLKILISLEGNAADFAEDAKPENRSAFVASCVDTFLRGRFAPGISEPNIFDGFDIDWESPQQQDAANFRALLVEFRRQMKAMRSGLRLTIAVGQAPRMLPGTDFAAIAPLVDLVGVMNYDYAGPWSTRTGLLAPLFSAPALSNQSDSIERSIASYKAAGVPEEKLLMGLPFYGYGWKGVGNVNNGLFQSGRAVHGDEPYHYIRGLAAPSSVHRDERSKEPWLFDGQTFWTYEDPVSVRYKVSYAADQHLGGVMVWELSGDTTDAELLNIAYRSLHHPLHSRVFAEAIAGEATATPYSPPPQSTPASTPASSEPAVPSTLSN